MAEHVLHKKETKKAPQKTLKEKREEKKAKKKGKEGWFFPNLTADARGLNGLTRIKIQILIFLSAYIRVHQRRTVGTHPRFKED